jgi:hypothetical protein
MDEAQGDLLTAEASQAEATSWYSDEHRDLVTRCGWKDPNDAVKSYRELEKSASGKIKMPTPASSAEEIRAFYQKTGCPENPDGYTFTIPETVEEYRDKEMESAIRQLAFDAGGKKQTIEAVVNGYYQKLADDFKRSKEEGEKELRAEFGDGYDEALATAERFFGECSSEFCSLIKRAGLASNPIVIREFLSKGKQMLSDTLVKGDGGGDNKEEYVPKNENSPQMYATMEGEEGEKARAWFTKNKGYKY